MSEQDSDGIAEAVNGQLRVVLAAAAMAGQQLFRQIEEARRRAQALAEQEARDLTERLEAERRTARADWAQADRPQWWDRATDEDVARVFTTAHGWSQAGDPEAARTVQLVADELRIRKGLSVDEVLRSAADQQRSRAEQAAAAEADRRALADAVEHVQQHDPARYQQYRTDAAELAVGTQARRAVDARLVADVKNARATQTDRAREETETVVTHVQADGLDAAADREHRDGPVHDSAERREATAQRMRDAGVPEDVVQARVHADWDQARPAREATGGDGRRHARLARRGHGPERGTEHTLDR